MKNVNLLIVDDEVQIREMLARHFKFNGYSVLTAEDGKDALEKLSNNKVDIVISDIMMPNMNGVELLKQIRTDYPMIKPIMITGYVTLDNILACIRYGADSCILKPISDLGELQSAVETASRKIAYWHNILKELKGLS
jgi:CheY-like chemotaxis protein